MQPSGKSNPGGSRDDHDEAWRIAAAENPKLFTPSESGQESDDEFQKDYQLRVVNGLGQR
jgi:hypothetical protein